MIFDDITRANPATRNTCVHLNGCLRQLFLCCLGYRVMTVEAARQCARDRKELRAVVEKELRTE